MKVLIAELLRCRNPLNCWMDIENTITKDEINNYLIKNPNPVLPPEPYRFNWFSPNLENAREDHIKRISYFVVNKSTKPILIDTMAPGLVDDGNHRLAAAYLKGDRTIDIEWCGIIDDMKMLFRRSCKLKLLTIE